MSIAFYNSNKPPSTFNPTNPAPKQTQSAQNKPNLNNSLIRLNAWLKKTYSNIPQNPKIKTNPNEPNSNPILALICGQGHYENCQTPIAELTCLQGSEANLWLEDTNGIKNIANLSKCLYINSLNLESINTNERIFPWIA